jgi:dihydroflavonol-4-reductase
MKDHFSSTFLAPCSIFNIPPLSSHKQLLMILVTGATGLLGSHLVKRLVAAGEPVRAMYRSSIPTFEHAEKVDWVKADILDIVSLEEALNGVTQVYHCAAIVSFNPRKKRMMYRINVEGTANLVNVCLSTDSIQRLLFVSSIAAMGRIREGKPIDETMQWSEETSNSEYGKTKYLAELEVWRGIGEGLDTVIVNPVIILGAGDWNKGSSEMFQSAYNEFPWYTKGKSGFVDVEDATAAMVQLMHTPSAGSERFILSGHNLSYREVFNRMADGFQKKPPHREATPFLSGIVWRLEAIKSWFTGKDPLLTRETARTALASVAIDNSKLQKFLPGFSYQPIDQSIRRICGELQKMHNL